MDNEAIRMQLEELAEAIRNLSEKQNTQYTDLMLKLDELKADKERLDLVLADSAQEFENQFEKAKSAVIKAGKASTSFIQRTLNVGYERAAKLIDRLEDEMIVGEADGAKPREVLVKSEDEETTPSAWMVGDDELYAEAKTAVLDAGKVSVSYLQRKFGIGYARSARIIDRLEEEGVVEKGDFDKPRKVIEQKA